MGSINSDELRAIRNKPFEAKKRHENKLVESGKKEIRPMDSLERMADEHAERMTHIKATRYLQENFRMCKVPTGPPATRAATAYHTNDSRLQRHKIVDLAAYHTEVLNLHNKEFCAIKVRGEYVIDTVYRGKCCACQQELKATLTQRSALDAVKKDEAWGVGQL